jgi:hypothetical protein
MATYKKKDFKKLKSEDLDKMDELVDADGSYIDDTDDIDNLGGFNSEIQTGPTLPYDEKDTPQTSKGHEKTAIQPRRYYGIDGTPYSHGGHGMAHMYEGEELDEVAKEKMRAMVKELISKSQKNKDGDMVNRNSINDVNPNLSVSSPVIANKVNELLKAIEGGNLSAKEVDNILNIIKTTYDAKNG